MLNDRLLVELDPDAAERRSSGGIVIPATAAVGKRLTWGTVVAAGQQVRQVEVGNRVLFDPDEARSSSTPAPTSCFVRRTCMRSRSRGPAAKERVCTSDGRALTCGPVAGLRRGPAGVPMVARLAEAAFAWLRTTRTSM
jgi:co-chaperonin GroES (HSP10)